MTRTDEVIAKAVDAFGPELTLALVKAHERGSAILSDIANGDIVVPPDSYFGMGDNRNRSLDSRYWGFISKDHVIGRPMFIYWSFVTPADQYQMRSAGDRLGFVAHIIIHFFDETRWSRTLRIVR